jgi:hypothetical protein
MADSLFPFRRAGGLLAAAGISILLGCAQQPPAATPSSGASGTAEAPPAAAPAAAKPAGVPLPEPPDGNWLVDDQGRQYFVDEVAKEEGRYVWLNPEKTRVQVSYGATYDVVGQDDDSFQVKIYRVQEQPAGRNTNAPPPPDLKKIAASYSNDTGKVDRLQFEPFGRGLPEGGQWRNGFEIADMNADGHLDIVHGPARKGGDRVPNIFLGDGKGNWRRWSEARFPPLPYDYGDVAVADFNGDRRPDIAMAVHLRGLIILVADGPQSFKEWGQGVGFQVAGSQDNGSGFSSRAVEAADLDRDGRPDVIALGEGPRMPTQGSSQARFISGSFGLIAYYNQGDGTWKPRDETADKVKLFGDDLAVAGFTGDDNLDIVLGSNVLGEKTILRIGGEGGSWKSADLQDLRPRSYVSAVDVADFNADGRPDLAIGYLSSEAGVWRTGIDLFLGRTDGSWERRGVAFVEGRDWLTALDSGDLDGDGRLDLAALTGVGETWVLLGKGNGSFLREEMSEVPPVQGGCQGYDIRIEDLDGEPGAEVVAGFAGEPSALFAPDQCPNEGILTAWKARPKK